MAEYHSETYSTFETFERVLHNEENVEELGKERLENEVELREERFENELVAREERLENEVEIREDRFKNEGVAREERLVQEDQALYQKEAFIEKEYIDTMEIKQNKNELHLYPINENEYIGAVDVKATITMNQPRTVFVLDSSVSMGGETARFVQHILPFVMSKLNYGDNDLIDFISFGEESEGGTNFAPAIEKLRSRLDYFQRFSTDRLIRILAISNGSIEDHENAEKETKKLIDFLATSELTINSQAVRLFTSDNQPDTKALSYLLQINNTTETNLCDIRADESDENIANAIVALFQSDGFQQNQSLEFEESIFLKFPWTTLQTKRMTLVPGWNIFWLKLMPIGAIKLEGSPIKVIIERQLTLGAFHQLMETKLAYIADHLTILKIVGSAEAIGLVDQISDYFKNTEGVLALKCSTPNKKIITNWLDGIVKNKTNFNDSTQMAEFLRMTHRKIERLRQKEREVREKELHRKKIEGDERCKMEAEIEVARGDRMKREIEERIKREVQDLRLSQEKERLQREMEESLKSKLDERMKREEVERIKREEVERIKREEVERIKREEVERIKREKLERIREKELRLNQETLVTNDSASAGKSEIDSNAVQTVFIIDESESGTRKGRRFTEKVIPLLLSKLFHETTQLVQLLTFVRHKTTVEQMLRSLQQTLDAKRAIRILLLTDGAVQERYIEDFCETITEFLGESNYSFEVEVVRVQSTKKYKLIDIDASESNEFIGKEIHMQHFCSLHFIIFLIIFALLFVRYIYTFIF